VFGDAFTCPHGRIHPCDYNVCVIHKYWNTVGMDFFFPFTYCIDTPHHLYSDRVSYTCTQIQPHVVLTANRYSKVEVY
jgi:hypothetical protein